ncbi:toprim domain-containing protein [Nocardia sp. CDC186]|uniref:Toprim domain-containing protein n=1 Tax=Nocardia implantans TaxID=3108168 RepID=A0ABU6B037_9NOCA|nr:MULTISPECIES: toprim domain-containing protein [unclassified Nocardia]MBF6191329.1 toprim domain-containing protein [Nocardia beijingensis]MEA3532970.1 toprim domain-containing protein [Nocardia sp. CDC192]MEB3512902.1 toprim domain-containing protein [Nocardia sp. CDC186]
MSAPARHDAAIAASWERVNTALEQAVGPGRPSGSWMKYCCPVHEAGPGRHDPSLIVKYLADAGRTKVQCQTGCDDRDVLDTIGLKVRDLYDRPIQRGQGRSRGRQPSRPRPRQVSRADRAIDAAGLPLTKPPRDLGRQLSPERPTATYPYAREDGTVAGEVIRKEARYEHGTGKSFYQRRWTENGMQPGGFEPIPFQLPRVLAAVEAGEPIFICEGEKDVLAAEQAGLTATCNAAGAGKWRPEHAAWLRGARTVVIVADRDAPGYRHAEKVAASLAGLVERVRIVQAATGKDLADHLACGHEVRELEPVAGLDPHTPITDRPTDSGRSASTPAAEARPVPAAALKTHPPTPGGNTVGEQFLAPQLHDAPADTTPDIDHAGAQLAMLWQTMLRHLIMLAQRQAEQRRRDMETLAARAREEQEQIQAQYAAERKAVETRLKALKDKGLDKASREEIADAVAQSRAWAPDSELAEQVWYDLRLHVFRHYDIYIDDNDEPKLEQHPDGLASQIQALEADRAFRDRASRAQDRMVAAIAAEAGLDESTRQALYADIARWQNHPTPATLDELTKKLSDAKVCEQTRTRIRFTAVYLTQGGSVETPYLRDNHAPALEATHLLRRMDQPLVDPGEEAKPRVDRLLVAYRDQLRLGAPTEHVRERLGQAVALLTAEDQKAARDRGVEIRKDPTGKFAPLWPDHVDREALAESVQMYAALQPHADRAAVAAGDYDGAAAVQLREQAARHRRRIQTAIKQGQGLHDLERDQLAAVLRDVDAGQPAPQMLWADDRTAAAVDAERAAQIAHDTTRVHRRQLEEILASSAVDPAAVRRTRDDVTRVMDEQTHLAAGRITLGDYGEHGSQERLAVALAAAGVPDAVRNRAINHVDRAAGEAAITGKQANRIRDRWAERTEAVVAARAAAKPDYDSPERRAEKEQTLKAAGLDDDQVAQHMAAAAGRANPPSAAVRYAPGDKPRRARSTQQGAGVRRTHHRGRGRGEQGLGR